MLKELDDEKVSENFKALIKHYSWDKLVEKKPKKFNITRLREFYSVLSEVESDEIVTEVSLRNVKISFTPMKINEILGCRNVEDNELYSVKWNLKDKQCLKEKALECQKILCPNTERVDNRFGFGDAEKDVKDIKHLVGYNILPSVKISAFGCKDACLTLAIWKKEPIDIGRLIDKRACKFAMKMKKGRVMPYPFFIDALCEDAGVPTQDGDESCVPRVTYLGRHVKKRKSRSPDVRSDPISNIIADLNVASSSGTNEVHNIELEELKKVMLNLTSRVDRMEANIIDYKDIVKGLNNNVMALTRGVMGVNDNMENLRKVTFENLRQLNDNMVKGFSYVLAACEETNKRLCGVQNLDLVRDRVQTVQPHNPTSSPTTPGIVPNLKPSILSGLSIAGNAVNESGESSNTKADKLNALAVAALTFHKNP